MRAELQQIARIESYLLEEMTAADRLQFENELSADSVLASQVEFQKNLMLGIENVALKASTQSAYGKFKVKSLLTKLFLSCLVVGAVTTSVVVWQNQTESIEPSTVETSTHNHETPGGDAAPKMVEHAIYIGDSVAMAEEVSDAYIMDNPDSGSDVALLREGEEDFFYSIDERNGAVPPNPEESDDAIGTVPLAFTPDGDGVNDYWCIPVNERMKEYQLKVYEHDGQTLFETDDPDEQWDGMMNGVYVPAGIYTYSLNAKGKDGKRYTKSGKITLQRGPSFDSQSLMNGLWVEIFFKKEEATRIKTSNLSDIIKNIKEENWNLMVPNRNLSSFKFSMYNDERKRNSDLVYMTFDPNFRWKFKNGNIFQKEGRYFYTIEGTGLDGKDWFLEDEVVWDGIEKRRKFGFGKKRRKSDEMEMSPIVNSNNTYQSQTLIIPNLITPNGDGQDDVWSVSLENVKELNVVVVDAESKEVVFETTDPNFTWDGTTKGVLNPPGIYEFTFSTEGHDGLRFVDSGIVAIEY